MFLHQHNNIVWDLPIFSLTDPKVGINSPLRRVKGPSYDGKQEVQTQMNLQMWTSLKQLFSLLVLSHLLPIHVSVLHYPLKSKFITLVGKDRQTPKVLNASLNFTYFL